MMNRLFFKSLAIIFLCTSFVAKAFETDAPFAYLEDFNTGAVLFEKNANEKMAPSSMTKIMTSYIIFKLLKDGHLKLDNEMFVSQNAWSKQGTKMFVAINSNVKLGDLIKGIVVQSGNDACTVVAESISGSETEFAKKMTSIAHQIGMSNSNFTNASGLPDDDHYSSCKDLATLSKKVISDFPEYYHYFKMREFKYNNINQFNKNTLLRRSDVDGLKTGHTDKGGFGVVISAIKGERRVIAVVNGLKNYKEREIAAESLINYGLNNFEYKKIINANEQISKVKVEGGKEEFCVAVSDKDINIVVEKFVDNNKQYEIKVEEAKNLTAPVSKGQEIGVVKIMDGEKMLVENKIYAQNAIEAAGFFSRQIHKAKIFLSKLF